MYLVIDFTGLPIIFDIDVFLGMRVHTILL